ncbi:hypothetical protein ACFL6U_25405 [Planctomycetota bacterium]
MDQKMNSFDMCDGIVVPVAALRQQNINDRYGHVEGLPDEELATPDELERMVNKEMWGPILRLPRQRWECSIRPNMDEDGRIDWGAFGSVDFDSYRPQVNKLRYLTGKLREQLKDVNIMVQIVKERIPEYAKFKIIKLVRDGVLDADDIEHGDMWLLARLCLRAGRLRQRIDDLEEKTRNQQQRRSEQFWYSRGC